MAKPFLHQRYTTSPPASPHHCIQPGAYPPIGSAEFRRRMQEVGDRYRQAGVQSIYLAHGTFAGPDAFGMIRDLGRVFPSASDWMRRVIKEMVDAVMQEVGNYTAHYARLFEAALHRDGEPRIRVRRFHWSSENHHIGRADGAVRLIDELAGLELPPGGRVLLWGHSHAGNVFALATNLLGGDRESVEAFFEAARVYYSWPLLGWVDIPLWRRVRELLGGCARPLAGRPLDIVSFGTPIRYGWHPGGYSRLLHFIHHRPAPGLPAYRAPFPPKIEHVLGAVDGDYVQQFGIAGTNLVPSLLQWRAWWADSRLARLLQPDAGNVLERFRAGTRVPEQGTTLLVDYGQPQGSVAQHFAGHAVYTRSQWLLFHAEQTAAWLYGEEESSDPRPMSDDPEDL